MKHNLEFEPTDITIEKEISSSKRAKQISKDYQKRKYQENRDIINHKRRIKSRKNKFNFNYEDLQAEYLATIEVKVYSQQL